MKQLIQYLSDGKTFISNIPSPKIKKGHILISTNLTLISSGTERMLVEFGKSNLIEKAKSQPDKVKQVLEKCKTDGVQTTFNAVKSKLEQPIPLGYNNVGIIIGLGEGVKGFNLGQRVVSNGPHAEIVLAPQNLCSAVPDDVEDETAVFTVVASIGLQGIRLANPVIGETVLVIGLGLIGLLTAQLLIAQGCKVLGLDTNLKRCKIAESYGIDTFCLDNNDNPLIWCTSQTKGIGVDAVIITAATSSNEPIDLAAKVCRKRGRIILVGVTGLDLKRDLFYKKELTFQVSCSYGPGRYDPEYEEQGKDYPLGFVRWTEKRNFEAILHLMSSKKINTDQLVSKISPLEEAPNLYAELTSNSENLGLLIKYKKVIKDQTKNILLRDKSDLKLTPTEPTISWIGAGNYANQILIPSFKKANAVFKTIASSSGIKPFFLGNKYYFERASTDEEEVIKNEESNTILITTRHDSHSELVIKSLEAGKNVFVEKPLCLKIKELESIKNSYKAINTADFNKKILMVGFNRRFSPLIKIIKEKIDKNADPKAFIYTCNAGFVPKDSWINDPLIGGGRLLGEACHFLDLLLYLSNSQIKDISLNSSSKDKQIGDIFSMQIKFENDSIGTINYLSNGSKSYPKERLEVFNAGSIYCLENFRILKTWGVAGNKKIRLLKQNKGQDECVKAFLEAIKKGTKPPIPADEIFMVHSALLSLL